MFRTVHRLAQLRPAGSAINISLDPQAQARAVNFERQDEEKTAVRTMHRLAQLRPAGSAINVSLDPQAQARAAAF